MHSETCVHRPVLLVSDLHLSRAPAESANALSELLKRHENHELVVNGDLFDLALDPPRQDPIASICEILAVHQGLVRALRTHLERGSPVTLLAGNHDAALANPTSREKLLAELDLPARAPLDTAAWFIRRGGVHIEHGHFYDPDNAPNHPLSEWNYETEPLGIAMTRRFVAPNGATVFAHAYETTPLVGLLTTFAEFHVRAPVVIARYLATAGGLCMRARTKRGAWREEWQRGEGELEALAERLGIDLEVLERLARSGPKPTHHGVRETFMRLYFDRIFATFGTAGGLAGALFGHPQGLLLAALSSAYLAASVKRQGSRYTSLPGRRLRDAATGIRETTGCSHVIFGHTHVEDEVKGYANSGSFGCSRTSRPYLCIEAGQVSRVRL